MPNLRPPRALTRTLARLALVLMYRVGLVEPYVLEEQRDG